MAARLPRPDTWTRPQHAATTARQGFGPEPILRCTFSHHNMSILSAFAIATYFLPTISLLGLARGPFMVLSSLLGWPASLLGLAYVIQFSPCGSFDGT